MLHGREERVAPHGSIARITHCGTAVAIRGFPASDGGGRAQAAFAAASTMVPQVPGEVRVRAAASATRFRLRAILLGCFQPGPGALLVLIADDTTHPDRARNFPVDREWQAAGRGEDAG